MPVVIWRDLNKPNLSRTDLDKTLEQRVKSVGSSEAMAELLKRLKEKDELFEYNIPVEIINSINDNGLLDYLRRTYSQSEFIVEDPYNISAYIDIGSEVIKKGMYKETLKPNTYGTIFLTNGKYVSIFLNDGTEWRVPLADLRVVHKRRKIRKDLDFGDTEGVEAESFKGHLMEGDRVLYKGKIIEKEDGTTIPDGARGRVVRFDRPGEFCGRAYGGEIDVVWYEQPGLIQKRTNCVGRMDYPSWEHCWAKDATRAEKLFNFKEIKLVKPNNVNFEGLYKECFKED